MENFNELLQKYADFIVRVGVNPQPGQTLIINMPGSVSACRDYCDFLLSGTALRHGLETLVKGSMECGE